MLGGAFFVERYNIAQIFYDLWNLFPPFASKWV